MNRPDLAAVIAANLNLVNPLRNIFSELDPACEVVDALEVLLAQETEHLAAVLNAAVDAWLTDEETRETVAQAIADRWAHPESLHPELVADATAALAALTQREEGE
jgi:hypothetical protein